MLSRIDYNGISWIDIQSPSREEISKLANELLLPSSLSEELLKRGFHPEAENYGDYIYLTFHIPLYDEREQYHHPRELDFAVSKTCILTLHYEPIEPLSNCLKKLEQDMNLRKEFFEKDTQKILYYIWKKNYEYLLSELDHIQKKIERIEYRIFSDGKTAMIEEISLLRRDMLDFSRSLRPHGMMIEEFSPLARSLFGPEFSKKIRELSQDYRRLISLADNNKDALEVLYDTYNALETRRSADAMKIFTMLALLTFPLTLIASIFSIDALARPIIGSENDFWIILGIMGIVVAGMLFFFKSKRWI
ncbi:CorA family divalent cation transporter [Candidatus Giovannonibacteria bacterium]|nr:CorA family divalent cation transporter [Candidatus Giovannonibacteria bacterium]